MTAPSDFAADEFPSTPNIIVGPPHITFQRSPQPLLARVPRHHPRPDDLVLLWGIGTPL
ncbi:hypothetical protein B484DRAFT_457493 [Ochromonadaceae sp. CCMP2298]|nr:hypothetical protein B484DRAFT_457493 [Ochromonadaceae sp. CCMP2298]